jgi:hypothetical protein
MWAALRSAIALSHAPLEDAEDGFVQVEPLSFGLSEHRLVPNPVQKGIDAHETRTGSGIRSSLVC